MVKPVTLVHVHHLLGGGVVVVEATELRLPLPVVRAFAHAVSAGGLHTVKATVEPVLVVRIAVAITTEAVVFAADCVLVWQGSTSRLASEHGALGIIRVRGLGWGYLPPQLGLGLGLGSGSGFEYALASRGLTDAVTAVAIGDAVLGGLIAKRLHFASALPLPAVPEPMTGDRVILVGRSVRLVIIVKLWQITVVLALPHLAGWVVAAAMVRGG